jgi:hypothetical protein
MKVVRTVCILMIGITSAPAGFRLPSVHGAGLEGKVEVRTLELGYVIESKALRVRAIPVGSAPVTELQSADPETIDRVLRFADMKSHGARLFVEIDGGHIKAMDASLGPAVSVAQ